MATGCGGALFYGAIEARQPAPWPDITIDGIDRSIRTLTSCVGGAAPHVRQTECALLALAGGRRNFPAKLIEWANGRHKLALDGWLVDQAGLAAKLGEAARGWSSDAALMAAALERWGDDALLHMHGSFALAWWDAQARRLLLACDRRGGRTLFWHEPTPGALRFASTVNILLADPTIPRVLDPDMVADTALHLAPTYGRTCFQGIGQLPTAHKLVLTPGGQRVERYWRIDPHRRIRFRRDEDYVEAARELLDRVVADHLPAEGPVVGMLSGGLDSSGLVATAARLPGVGQVQALSVRPAQDAPLPHLPGQMTDEWPVARRVADMHPNVRAIPIVARCEAIEDRLRATMPFNGRPPVHLMANPWYAELWAEARRLGAAAVIGGLSGNMTLSASGLTNGQSPSSPADMPAALHGLVTELRHRPGWGTLRGGLYNLAPYTVRRLWNRLKGRGGDLRLPSALTDAMVAHLQVERRNADRMRGDRDAPYAVRRRLWFLERSWQAVGMQSTVRLVRGTDYLDPLGDVRMAEFCLALPQRQFIHGGVDRRLARRVLADRLPPEIVNEERFGRQNAEWHHWMTGMRPWLAEHLDRLDRSPLGRELVDVPRLRALLDDWPADADAAEPHLLDLTHALGSGVKLGVFLRWAEGGND